MHYSFFILFLHLCSAGILLATSATGQTVTLQLRQSAAADVFRAIEQQASVRFVYKASDLQGVPPITLSVQTHTLKRVLKELEQITPFSFRQRGKLIAVAKREGRMAAMRPEAVDRPAAEIASLDTSILLSGTVTSSETNQPLQGASIKVTGRGGVLPKRADALTGNEGKFSIRTTLTEGEIQISFVGYQTQTIRFGPENKGPFTIRLERDDNTLEEVEINTGYQTIAPERFVGSAVKLDSTSFHRRTGMGIIERLKGTVTGVQFGKETGGTVQQLPMVRGLSTLTLGALSPLVVVDNFPMDERFDLNSIHPEDVLDITILKDAAAASIWGTLAGNGVIVITTKKGQYNQPFRISASSNRGITEKPDLYYYPRMSVQEVIDVERFLFGKGFYDANLGNTTTRPVISPVVELLNKVREGTLEADEAERQIDILSGQDIRHDLNRYLFRQAIGQQHHLSVNGGSDNLRYNVSAGYNRTQPNLQGASAAEQYTVRSGTHFKPAHDLEVSTGLQYSMHTNRAPGFPAIPSIPYLKLADEAGNPLAADRYRSAYLDTVGGGRLLDWHYRPLDEVHLADNSSVNQFVSLNVAAAYRVRSWLKASITYQYQQQQVNVKNHYNAESYFARDLINRYSQITGEQVTRVIPVGGILDISNRAARSHNLRSQLDAAFSRQGHQLNGMVVAEVHRSDEPFRSGNRFYGYNDDIETYTTGLNYATYFPIFQRISGNTARIPQQSTVGSGVTNHRLSLLGNVSYTFGNLFTLYTSARKDGANVFGVKTNNKWKPLWSAGGSWNIGDSYLSGVDRIGRLRLRASHGYMGNTTGGSGFTTIYYQPDGAPITNLPQATIGAPPNPGLRWEEVRVSNLGVDFSVFGDRLSGSVETFHKRTKDIVSALPFDPTTGVDEFVVNAASLRGRGTEVQLRSQNVKGAFSWQTDLGYTFTKTVVTELYNGKFSASDFITYGINAAVNRVAYGISSYRWAGLDPETGDPMGYLDGIATKDYQGIFNDAVDNQVFHGSSLPMHFGYLSNTFRYKGIQVSANITYGFAYYFRKPAITYWNLFSQGSGHADYTDRWQQPGDEAFTTIPSMVYPANSTRDNFYAYSAIHVLRGDHVRLQDVRAAYEIEKKQLGRLPVNSIQLSLYVNNLNTILWRKNKAQLDPDFLTPSGSLNAPPSRSWTFGINVNL